MDALAILDANTAGRGLARPASAQAAQAAKGDHGQLREVAEQFEAQFLGQMFQLAMKDMPIDEVFGGGPGERMFRDLLTNAWADGAVRAGGVGVADSVMRSLIHLQEE